MSRIARWMAAWACACLLGVPAAWAQPRHALVIGNASYKDAPLVNPVNDARAMADSLRASGFQVALRENLDHRGMQQAIREFGDRLRSGGVGVFYFAGHGMQIKGRNYLIPVGAVIEREDEVAYAALDAQAVLDKMETAGNIANVMVLDACRNNPFARSFRSRSQGLAQMDAPAGTMVAFATAPGSVASDGDGRNGLYTQQLLTHMREPGLKIEDVFKRTRADVRRLSDGKQVPWESTSLEGDVYFQPPRAPASAQGELEKAMWDMVKSSTQPLELRAYLARFPQGRYAGEAQARLASLQPPAAPAAPPAVAPARPPAASSPTATAAALPKPPTQRPAPEPLPPPVVHDPDLERRTEEIIAEIMKQQPAIAAAAPATSQRPNSARPPPPNAFGFRVGDRWRYQVVDKYLGEVVENYTLKVDRILDNGGMNWNGKQIVTTPAGNVLSNEPGSWVSRKFGDGDIVIPDQFREGYRQDVRFTITGEPRGGQPFVEQWKGTLAVRRLENIKVPAGEFMAWRIEREMEFSGERANGTRWFGRHTFTGWWVPELRNFAAAETENRVGTSPPDRRRRELTSYEIGGTRTAQR